MLMINARHPLTWNMGGAQTRVEGKAADVPGAALVGKPDGAVMMVRQPGTQTMVGVQTSARGTAADVHGTVVAGRPDGDVIGTNASMMVITGRAGITAGMCPFLMLEYGNDGDREHLKVWIAGPKFASCSGLRIVLDEPGAF